MENYRVIHKDEFKHTEVRLGISEFNGVEYLQVRKYYQDFNEEWKPGNEGVNIPLSIEVVQESFLGLMDILADTEPKSLVEEHFSDLLNLIKNKS